MVWSVTNAQCNESKKIVWEVAKYLRGRGVDLGAGDFKVLPHAISVDNGNHAQFGFVMRPDVSSDCEKLDVFASASLDFVYSSHLLEHIEDTEAALKEWWRLVKLGGYMVLYLPDKRFYPNIGQPGANPDHKHDFLPEDIISKMPDGWDLVERQDRNENEEYSFLLVFKKRSSRVNVLSWRDAKPEKTACVVRYGAYGDLIQASSVFAGLKDQGYHVTLFSSLPGTLIIENDPNIDDLVLFDRDQVPNADLSSFWAYQKKKFTKFVNLSESVEGTMLAMPGRTIHFFPPAARHMVMNHNYLEVQHALAGVPHNPKVRFFATEEEKQWAKKQHNKAGTGPLVLWALAGSSVHKTWPYLDSALATIMLTFPTATVVLTGGPDGVILEAGWENEPRVWKTSGKWTIRQCAALLAECDVVIGPETGIVNAAANLPATKIVFLSHSTEDNLTRDWTNTVALRAPATHCPGRGNNDAPACHVLHYGWDHCSRDETTGTAKCQSELTMDVVWPIIENALIKVDKK